VAAPHPRVDCQAQQTTFVCLKVFGCVNILNPVTPRIFEPKGFIAFQEDLEIGISSEDSKLWIRTAAISKAGLITIMVVFSATMVANQLDVVIQENAASIEFCRAVALSFWIFKGLMGGSKHAEVQHRFVIDLLVHNFFIYLKADMMD
jgi:hypothetical protein